MSKERRLPDLTTSRVLYTFYPAREKRVLKRCLGKGIESCEDFEVDSDVQTDFEVSTDKATNTELTCEDMYIVKGE